MPIFQGVLCADSIGAGFIGSSNGNSWAKLASERLSNTGALPPLISPGLRAIMATGAQPEWSVTGSWTGAVSTDLFDRGPFGYAYYSAAGTSATRTWTNPVWARAILGVEIWWIDYTVPAGSSAGDFQYSLDGGATWHNAGQTILHDNKLKKFYVDNGGAPIPSVILRAYDGVNPAGVCAVGVTPYYVDPHTVTNGFIFHNISAPGFFLAALSAVTSGDRMACLDPRTVTLGTGSPIPLQPDFVIAGPFSNDIGLGGPTDGSGYATTLHALITRVVSTGVRTFGWISCYEQDPAGRDATVQANYRAAAEAQMATDAVAYGIRAPFLSFFGEWSANAWGSVGTQFAATTAAGMMNDGLHPAQAGHFDLATRFSQWIVARILTGGVTARSRTFDFGRSIVGKVDSIGGRFQAYIGPQQSIPLRFDKGVPFPYANSRTTRGLDFFSRGQAVSFDTSTGAWGFAFPESLGLTDPSSSMSVVGRSPSDGEGLTDQRTLALTKNRTDPLGITDVETRTTAQVRTITDGLNAVDSVSLPPVARSRIINDDLQLDDDSGTHGANPNDLSFFSRGAAFGVGSSASSSYGLDLFSRRSAIGFGVGPITALPLAAAAYARTRTDAEGATDVLNILRTIPFINNPLALVDSLIVSNGPARTIVDPLGTYDDGLAWTDSADPVGIGDVIALGKGKVRTDALAMTDGIVVSKTTAVAPVVDPLSLHDSVLAVIGNFPIFGNPETIHDAITRALGRTLNNPLGITDPRVLQTGSARSRIDVLGITDGIVVRKTIGRTINDNEQALDALAVLFNSNAQALITDAALLSDNEARVVAAARAADDAFGLNDAVSVALGRTLTNGLGATDAASAAHGWTSFIEDGLGTSDEALRTAVVVWVLSNALNARDNIVRASDVAVTLDEDEVLLDLMRARNTALYRFGKRGRANPVRTKRGI